MGRPICYNGAMQLDTSRFFSDRLVFDDTSPSKFRIVSGFWEWVKRIVSWIYSPAVYSDENRRTVECFKSYLIDTLGENRLKRISSRYELDWEEMKKSPLLSRDVAKIFIGSKCVSVEDVNESIQGDFSTLTSKALATHIKELSSPFDQMWKVADITKRIAGGPSEWLSRVFYDPFLLDREKLQLVKDHPKNSFEHFVHSMVARVIKREPDVGLLIPGPDHPKRFSQFYYVSGKLITGKGMVSYILHPAGSDTNLKPVRLFRGTSLRNSELDALSTVITDLEDDLGRTAYRSGKIFECVIQEMLGQAEIEGGHSMGATLVQHRLANMDHIREAYLYSGPGVKEKALIKFNEKNPKVRLVIRTASNDPLHKVGEAHLGYQAPSNVTVDFAKYRPIKETSIPHAHAAVWEQESEYFEKVEIAPETRDKHLYHKNNLKERCRSCFGPLAAGPLACLRDLIRSVFSCSRINTENGLKIGHMVGRKWRVEHFQCV